MLVHRRCGKMVADIAFRACPSTIIKIFEFEQKPEACWITEAVSSLFFETVFRFIFQVSLSSSRLPRNKRYRGILIENDPHHVACLLLYLFFCYQAGGGISNVCKTFFKKTSHYHPRLLASAMHMVSVPLQGILSIIYTIAI